MAEKGLGIGGQRREGFGGGSGSEPRDTQVVLYPAPRARAPPGFRVSFVLTSCVAVDGRLTLLEETVESFLTANTYPIDRYVLIDDSGDVEVHKRLIALFGDAMDVVVNVRARTGMTFSIDTAYSMVDSDYIFHCQVKPDLPV